MNAAVEFNNFIVTKPRVICAWVQEQIGRWTDDGEDIPRICLPLGHTTKQYAEFMSKLDFTYDDGYGGQELDGVIWFEDGTWADRGEYDGSEWWQYHKLPEVPTYLYPEEPEYDSAGFTEQDR